MLPLFLKRPPFSVALGRQSAGQDSLTPARQQGRIMGAPSTTFHRKGMALVVEEDVLRGLTQTSGMGFGYFRTAAACQQSWERTVGWSCTVPKVQLPPNVPLHTSATAVQLHNLYVIS